MIGSMRARHGALGVLVIVLAGLAFGGCLGPAVGDERITSYDVVAVIRDDRTVAVREVIDWDFGPEEKHGIFRTIPSTGGVPTDVEVSSPDAPDAFATTSMGGDTEIKIGDAGRKITGRHRYVISYVLPATVEGDRFALDAIGDQWPVASGNVTVTVLGADLLSTECFMGPYGSTERCPIDATGDTYRTEVDGLDAHEGVTVAGDIVAVRPAALPDVPAFEDRDASARLRWAGIVAGLGLVMAVGVYLICRQLGRNAVAGGGATEAAFAYGAEEFGPEHAVPTDAPPDLPGGTRLVADTRMGELAGIEFVPPGGVEPWQAAVVLREKIDDRTVGAWFASLVAHDIVSIESRGGGVLRTGPAADEADPAAAPILNRAFGSRDEIELGTYDPKFSAAWAEAGRAIDTWTLSSGVFRRRPPQYGAGSSGGVRPPWACLAPAAFFVFAGGGSLAAGLTSAFAAVALTIVVVGGAAMFAYSRLTRGLTARGSAIAIRAESFRRFLHDSEAQHVEWAWQNHLLREYSAWAVALGEADAWNSALSASSVPPVEVTSSTGVLYPALYASSFSSTTTAPPAPSSGGSSGSSSSFSGGGFSGGGGGGGGGGSW
ncbi:MAG TPA: DUF2207 domain-containing protein [Iamia sp.]|nr:DUF2207 domain-containing protein [Iamia sp.]